MISAQEYERIQRLKRNALRAKLDQATAEAQAGRLVASKRLMTELRKRVRNHSAG